MKRLTRILMTATLLAGMFMMSGQNASADRICGPGLGTPSVVGY